MFSNLKKFNIGHSYNMIMNKNYFCLLEEHILLGHCSPHTLGTVALGENRYIVRAGGNILDCG